MSDYGLPSRTDVMCSLPRTLALLAVSCDATAPAAQTPVQVVELAPPPGHDIAGDGALRVERAAPAPSAARFPESCRSSAFEPDSGEIAATVNLLSGSLSVRVVHRAHSNDDFCLTTLTDARGSVIDCKTFADEGCDLEVPVATAERITVEGVCITKRCAVASQRARRVFEVVAGSASGIEVRAITGEVVMECAEE